MQELAHEFAEHRLQAPNTLMRAGGLYLLRSGCNRAKPGYRAGPRMIDCYSFHFIVAGNLALKDEKGRKFHFGPKTMFCLFPGVRYTYWEEESKGALRMHWLAFAGPQAPLAAAALGLSPERPALEYGRGTRLEQVVRQLHGSVGGGSPFRQSRMLYELFEQLQAAAQRERGASSREADWLRRSEAYLRLHYAEPLRIDALAKQAGVHRSHFSSAFRKAYGLSPKQFVTRLRLETAAAMLASKNIPVKDAALSAGYPDVFAFTRAFTKHYGMPPTKYRELHGN